ncbi:hypothetical protein [Microbacterium sp.]
MTNSQPSQDTSNNTLKKLLKNVAYLALGIAVAYVAITLFF